MGVLIEKSGGAYSAFTAGRLARVGFFFGTPAFAGRALLAIAPLAIVAWLTYELGVALSSARRKAAALAAGDALTGLPARRAFLDNLEEEVVLAARRGTPTALLVLDLGGIVLADANAASWSDALPDGRLVSVHDSWVRIGSTIFSQVAIEDMLDGLIAQTPVFGGRGNAPAPAMLAVTGTL